MNFNKGPAILGLLTAIVVVVAVLLISGGEDAETPPADGDAAAQTTTAQVKPKPEDAQKQKPKPDGQGAGSEVDDEPVIEVENGETVGGVRELAFAPGDEIRFAVASDTADEIHFHGYDIYADIPAGGEGEVKATADIQGVFEVELHETGTLVAEVTVSP